MKKVAIFALAACVVAPALAGAQTSGQQPGQSGQYGQQDQVTPPSASGQPSKPGQSSQSGSSGSSSQYGQSSQPGQASPSSQPSASGPTSQPTQTSQPAQPGAPQISGTSGMSGQQGLQVQSKTLVGSTVRNREGKDIGKVANLLIDPSQGRVNGVVVSMGGVAGFGAQEITVPWSALQVTRDEQNIVVTLQQDVLQQAPRQAEDRKNGSGGQASPGQNSQERRR